jgi:hypothetical protein
VALVVTSSKMLIRLAILACRNEDTS